MPRSLVAAVGLLAALAVTATQAQAQARKAPTIPARGLGPPFVQSMFPPGICAGQTTEVTLSGTRLESITSWLVSGSGLEIQPVKSTGPGKYSVPIKASADAEPGIRELWAVGTDGISNLVLFRVDRLRQGLEVEPNDTPEKATPLTLGTAIAGTLNSQDLDYYRVEARAGQRVVIEVEAQQLGVGVAPIVTVYSEHGSALAQGRERAGPEHDPCFAFTFPQDGAYYIVVNDVAYSGAPTAVYRLRLDTVPFATALYPLGGPAGEKITVFASGGSLFEPLAKTITLPREPGTIIDVGPFDSPNGPVAAPGKLIVGDGPEIDEPSARHENSPIPLPLETTVDGRLDRIGEVDRFEIQAKKGQALRFKVLAAPLGSWLDSVLVLRDEKGDVLAENDDLGPVNNNQRTRIALGLGENPPDSRLEYLPTADGTLTLELLDRYGRGGPEYAYRLVAFGAKPDFTIAVIIVNPLANNRLVAAGSRPIAVAPGTTGSFSLKPGSQQLVNFLITPEGFRGDIQVTAEGLPQGVTAIPAKVRVPPNAPRNQQPMGGSITLRGKPDAEVETAFMHIVAHAKPDRGEPFTRTASAVLAFPPVPGSQPNAPPTRIVTRSISAFPVALAGVAKRSPVADRDARGGRRVVYKGISEPGPLLQGSQIELKVVLDPPLADLTRYRLDAQVDAKNLIVQTVLPDLELVSDTVSEQPTPLVRLIAGPRCTPGPKRLAVLFGLKGAQEMVQELTIDVRAPVLLKAPEKPIVLVPGGTAAVRVELSREAGVNGSLTLHAEGLPKGVKLAENAVKVGERENSGELRLEMEPAAPPLDKPVAFRVYGQIRMERGLVRLESANRPMVMSHSAEK